VVDLLFIYLANLETEAERIKMSEIYEKYKPMMLRYALQLTKSKETAEDAVHDAFMAIIKHKEKYISKPCRDLRVSIVIITKNKCIDLMRKSNAVVYDNHDDMDDVISDEAAIEEQIILIEEYETIKKHIASLDEQSRLVLEMRYILDMSYAEIGAELGLTAKHVDTKIMRAKEKVRKLIALGGA